MSAICRLSCSRTILARAIQPAKMVNRAAAVAPMRIARNLSSASFNGAINFPQRIQQQEIFKGFHCSAMSFDAEVGEDSTDAVSTGAPDTTKLYVGNISWNVVDEDLRQAFAAYGNVESAEVIMDPNGRSRGFGFVSMGSTDEATAAIQAMNHEILAGREMRVDFHIPRDRDAPRVQREFTPRRSFSENVNRIYIGNLPWSFDDFDLQDTFETFGKVIDAKVITDRETGRSRGFGFVTMETSEAVDDAIAELDNSTCDGRSIRVNRANN